MEENKSRNYVRTSANSELVPNSHGNFSLSLHHPSSFSVRNHNAFLEKRIGGCLGEYIRTIV